MVSETSLRAFSSLSHATATNSSLGVFQRITGEHNIGGINAVVKADLAGGIVGNRP